jgi:hypothetical protein
MEEDILIKYSHLLERHETMLKIKLDDPAQRDLGEIARSMRYEDLSDYMADGYNRNALTVAETLQEMAKPREGGNSFGNGMTYSPGDLTK